MFTFRSDLIAGQFKAVVASAGERARLWPRLVDAYADFDSYQSSTEREIPVIILQPR